MGVGWGKFYQHGVEARLYLFLGDGTLSVSVEKVKPSLLDGLFFVVYAVGSVLAETPTSGNNIDTSGENNSTIKDTKMLFCILLVLITVLFLQAFNIIKLN